MDETSPVLPTDPEPQFVAPDAAETPAAAALPADTAPADTGPARPDHSMAVPSVPVTNDAGSPWKTVGSEIVAGLQTLFSAAVYATLIVTFGFQVARVDGLSMAPTLEDRDRLIVNKLV